MSFLIFSIYTKAASTNDCSIPQTGIYAENDTHMGFIMYGSSHVNILTNNNSNLIHTRIV
uniref:Uncharacterized protein n=1 Tax=Rhizophora mucronata TaxID=61149 RepID=A0A2P2KVZ1_RHIMU